MDKLQGEKWFDFAWNWGGASLVGKSIFLKRIVPRNFRGLHIFLWKATVYRKVTTRNSNGKHENLLVGRQNYWPPAQSSPASVIGVVYRPEYQNSPASCIYTVAIGLSSSTASLYSLNNNYLLPIEVLVPGSKTIASCYIAIAKWREEGRTSGV